jgi:hypothetical protein
MLNDIHVECERIDAAIRIQLSDVLQVVDAPSYNILRR